jgi:hypothetical protein
MYDPPFTADNSGFLCIEGFLNGTAVLSFFEERKEK